MQSKRYSKNNFALTGLEKKIMEQLNIPEATLDKTATDVTNHLNILTIGTVQNGQPINGRLVRKSVDTLLKGNDAYFVKNQVKEGKEYVFNEIRDLIKYGKFQS